MPKQETTTRFTTQRWFESNDYGKECFVDELLASHGSLLAALEGIALGGCCQTPKCSPDDPKCDAMVARAAIAQAKGESSS